MQLDDRAKASFDERGSGSRVAVKHGLQRGGPSGGVAGELPVQTISTSDLSGPVTSWQREGPKSILRVDQGVASGLLGADAESFFRLVDSLHKALRPRNVVSHESAMGVAFDWLFGREAESFSGYCVRLLKALVEERVVLIPIHELRIQVGFAVGHVAFEPLTAARIKKWHKSDGYTKLASEERQFVDERFRLFARKHQGRAIASTVVKAEAVQARAVALELVDDALAMLRFFSDASLSPYLRSTCVPAGRQRDESFVAVLEEDGKFAGEQRGVLDPDRAPPWNLSVGELAHYRQVGLDRLSHLLQKEKRTEFQERVMASVRLHSEAVLEVSVQTRLVLVLAALESLYLVNPHEPIQQNVGQRLAMMVEDDVDKRMEIPPLVRAIYDIRSKFVHHATMFDVSDELDRFCRYAWLGLVRALDRVDQFETAGQFVDEIERRRMNG